MANVVLTGTCDLACSYCFAPDAGGERMSRREVHGLARLLRDDGREVLALVGGEPTLHPEIVPIIGDALELGLRVRLFTHGRIAEPVLAALEALPRDRFLAVVNASAGLCAGGDLHPVVVAALRRLGPRACLGITITGREPARLRALSLYEDLGLAKLLRLSIAHPTIDGRNVHPDDPRSPDLGATIAAIAVAGATRGVRVELDCGFTLCTFTPAQLRELREHGVQVRSVCGPIPDVGPGGQTWPCFPLRARYESAVDLHGSLAAVRRHFEEKLRGFRAAGLYDECRTCDHFEAGRCTGGCLARVMRTFASVRVFEGGP